MSTTSIYFSASVKDHIVLECGPYGYPLLFGVQFDTKWFQNEFALLVIDFTLLDTDVTFQINVDFRKWLLAYHFVRHINIYLTLLEPESTLI